MIPKNTLWILFGASEKWILRQNEVEMKKNTELSGSRFFLFALFWGSLWGISEATLGHVLHLFGIPGAAGFVMFPLALYFMSQAYLLTGLRSAIFLTAVVACCIKLTDFFLPTPTPFTVINPAMAILFESFVVLLLFPDKSRSESRMSLLRFLGMAISWRLCYAFFLLGLGLFVSVPSFLDLGLENSLRFFALESLVNALLLYLIFLYFCKPKIRDE